MVPVDPLYQASATPKEYVDRGDVTSVSLELDETTYQIRAKVKLGSGAVITSTPIDLPLETMILNAEVSEDGKSLILTLNNEEKTQVIFDVAELLNGLASQSYVDNGLAGKIDKPTAEWKVPVSQGRDENGNIKYGTMTYTSSPQSSAIPFWTYNKTLKTEKAVDDDDAVNLAQLIAALATKLDANTDKDGYTKIYARTSAGDQALINLIAGNQVDAIARFTTKSHQRWGTIDDGGVLITGYPSPNKPYQCAPVKYVDDNLAPIQEQLGNLFTSKEIENYTPISSALIQLPEGVLPNICIESALVEVGVENVSTGEMYSETVEINSVRIANETAGTDRTVTFSQGDIITLQEGESLLVFIDSNYSFVPEDGWVISMAEPYVSTKIICQVFKY